MLPSEIQQISLSLL